MGRPRRSPPRRLRGRQHSARLERPAARLLHPRRSLGAPLGPDRLGAPEPARRSRRVVRRRRHHRQLPPDLPGPRHHRRQLHRHARHHRGHVPARPARPHRSHPAHRGKVARANRRTALPPSRAHRTIAGTDSNVKPCLGQTQTPAARSRPWLRAATHATVTRQVPHATGGRPSPAGEKPSAPGAEGAQGSAYPNPRRREAPGRADDRRPVRVAAEVSGQRSCDQHPGGPQQEQAPRRGLRTQAHRPVKRVFVDTSGVFAPYSANDADHVAAVDVFRQANDQRWQLITTNMVVAETHALLLNRAREGRALAMRFLDDLESSELRIERVTEDDERGAIELLRAHQDKTYSFCDALSFVVCERLRIADAISCDDDFRSFRSYGRLTVLL
ncbi:MAG: PIN domain-containing protein [Deltaproteobacteria bacterium]|nr:MAG: PIN domain-containing protein [Deltaproteobacteria bacterium]